MNKAGPGTSRSAEKRAGGAGNCRSYLRASWFNRHPQMRLTPAQPESTHCQERFLNPPALMHHEPEAPDGHWSNIPERDTGRHTNPNVHACPTPHCGKTLRRAGPPSQSRPIASSTRPTASAYPLCQAPPSGTQGVAATPAARPRRLSTPCTQSRAEHVCPRGSCP